MKKEDIQIKVDNIKKKFDKNKSISYYFLASICDGPTRGVEIADLNNPYWTETFNGRVRRVVE